jgi:hypothetical protein
MPGMICHTCPRLLMMYNATSDEHTRCHLLQHQPPTWRGQKARPSQTVCPGCPAAPGPGLRPAWAGTAPPPRGCAPMCSDSSWGWGWGWGVREQQLAFLTQGHSDCHLSRWVRFGCCALHAAACSRMPSHAVAYSGVQWCAVGLCYAEDNPGSQRTAQCSRHSSHMPGPEVSNACLNHD